MTKRSFTPPGAVLVAIDVAKNRQEVLIERPEGGRRRRMTMLRPHINARIQRSTSVRSDRTYEAGPWCNRTPERRRSWP